MSHARRVAQIFFMRVPQQALQFVKIETCAKSLTRSRKYHDLRGRPLDRIQSAQQFFDQRKLIAFRFSGRSSVIVATPESNES